MRDDSVVIDENFLPVVSREVDTSIINSLRKDVVTKKIAILGTTPSRMEAPVGDDGWEIWTIGPGGKDLHRWDRLYETHTVWPEDFSGYLNDLSKVERPRTVRSIVPMKSRMEHWAHRCGKDEAWLKATITGDWSANEVIDRELLFERYRKMWFSTSICYALVDAIESGTKTIGCFGIDLESDEEHVAQFVGCAHFLDIARLIGIDIVLPSGCGLECDLNPYPDRYETHLALTYEKKLKLLAALIVQAEQEVAGRRMMIHRIEGAVLKLQEIRQSKPDAIDISVISAGEQELARLNAEFCQVVSRLDRLHGEKSATEFYVRKFTWGMFDPNRQI